jgi:hypothetical protein
MVGACLFPVPRPIWSRLVEQPNHRFKMRLNPIEVIVHFMFVFRIKLIDLFEHKYKSEYIVAKRFTDELEQGQNGRQFSRTKKW